MPTEVRLPNLGDSISHAKLTVWLKKVGEPVRRGEIIAEVETDKTSVEIEAPDDGVLASIEVQAGTEDVAVNQLLALLGDAGATVASPVVVAAAPPTSKQVEPERARPSGGDRGVGSDDDDSAIAASPLVRRMAFAAGIPLRSIHGTGPGGRVLREDVEGLLDPPQPVAARGASRSTSGVATAALPSDDEGRYVVAPLSTMKRVSGERLTQSKQQIPHFYLRVECAMDAVARARDEINARRADRLSFTAFVLRAAALALQKVPAANAMWVNGAVRLYKTVDLAVAVNTPSGLVAPVVRSAEGKSVVALNQEMQALAERAKLGKLRPEDYNGGTCTVSNLGMFGVTSLYPIINPPQTCILGVGVVEERPVVRDHAVTVGLMMTCTLAADHRALDGAVGAELLAAFRGLIEDPWALAL